MRRLKFTTFSRIKRNEKWVVVLIGCLIEAGLVFGQPGKEVWIKVAQGNVLYLNPVGAEWTPVASKEKILVKTFLLTGESADATIFRETETYHLPPNAYFFINDIFHRNRLEVIGALARIEAQQLPTNVAPDSQKVIGLTFGNSQLSGDEGDIPHENERRNAIIGFISQNNYAAALLSLKRMLTRYPSAYLSRNYAEQLFVLYDSLQLYGLLLDETKLLLQIDTSKDFHQKFQEWHDYTQKKLLDE